MRTHWFNPGNDLALAAGTPSYTPPAQVQRFGQSLELLPALYAQPGDSILVGDWTSEKEEFAASFGLSLNCADGIAAPWGWSAATVTALKGKGSKGPWPDTGLIRELSHRRSTIKLHTLLCEQNLPYPMPPAPIEVSDASLLPGGGGHIAKAPWSCSGRGVAPLSERFAIDCIRRQGSVMVEQELCKVQDFALLFTVKSGEATFEGLSSFITASGNTTYAGNLCADQDALRRKIGMVRQLDATIEACSRVIADVLEGYDGPCGIDMMVYSDDSGRRIINPCVEINVRMTMGFVAMAVAKKYGSGILRTVAGSQKDSLLPPSPYFSLTFNPIRIH